MSPFQNLNVSDLTRELGQRELIRGVFDEKKNQNCKIFKRSFVRHCQTTSIMLSKWRSVREGLNLENYEVFLVEPLHDTKSHIKNIWDVSPECPNEQQKKTFYDTLHGCYGNKDKVRGCDY